MATVMLQFLTIQFKAAVHWIRRWNWLFMIKFMLEILYLSLAVL